VLMSKSFMKVASPNTTSPLRGSKIRRKSSPCFASVSSSAATVGNGFCLSIQKRYSTYRCLTGISCVVRLAILRGSLRSFFTAEKNSFPGVCVWVK
jgi:hypothetical protein